MRLSEPSGSRTSARLIAAALIAAGAAGCSDSSRFGETAFSNPFASRQDASHQVAAQSAPVAQVQAQPLPPQSGTPSPGPTSTYYPPRDTTGSLTSNSRAAAGTEITVEPGDTVTRIAHRYRVSRAAIVRANHLGATASIQAGQRLIIPGGRTAASHIAMPRSAVAATSPRKTTQHGPRVAGTAPGGVHVVAPGETLSSVAHRYRQSRSKLARANDLAPDAKLKVGQQLTIPGAKPSQVAHATSNEAAQAAAPARVAPAPARSTSPQRVATADGGMPMPAPEPTVAKIEATTEAPNSTVGFRWPVRGRIISGFASEANGQRNDGINLAVPEGTSIKAAEDGTVAYAGNELKGYGNLLLIRHNNGFVTAYAHASELLVKRGDQVKRGQTIARAGQTGSVTSPQVHFEIRKGATPVDPMHYLSGT